MIIRKSWSVPDFSVLINFLAVDRLDLIARHGSRFMITDHVGYEVLAHYAEQFARLQNALTQGILEPIAVTAQEEVETFARLEAGSFCVG